MCKGVSLHACLCTMSVPDAHEGQKRALDPVELELHGYELPHGFWKQNLGEGP